MVTRRLVVLLAAAALATGLAGCGKKLYSVKGKATLDGKPLEDATVTLHPEQEGLAPAGGQTSPDGEFEVRLDRGGGQGAYEGTYKVLVSKVVPLDPLPPEAAQKMKRSELMARAMARKSAIPDRYTSLNTTPLRCKVPPDGPLLLELTSGGPGAP